MIRSFSILILGAALVSCGSVNASVDANAGETDADTVVGTDAGSLSDALVTDAPIVDASLSDDASITPDAWSLPTGVWTTGDSVINVSAVTNEATPAISSNGLEMYFIRFDPEIVGTMGDIWRATRFDTTSNFGAPGKIVVVSTFGNEKDVYISPDGLELYWTVADIALYVSVRASPETTSPWSAPTPLDFAGGSPSVTADGLILYYTNNGLLKERRRTSKTVPWSDETVIAWPLVDSTWRAAQLSSNGLALLLSNSGNSTFARVVYSTRDTIDAAWSAPIVINELNLWANFDARWSADMTEIYFSSDRPTSLGLKDIYRSVLQ